NDLYKHAIETHAIWPVAQPSVDIKTINEEALEVVFTIAIKPEFELGEYKGLSVTKEAAIIEDSEVEAQLEALRNQNVSLEVVEQAIEDGNTAVIDFEGFKDGVAFEGGKGESYPLEIGSNSFIPGFEEQLIGKKANDELDVVVTFPEEYQAPDLAGQEVVFKVLVHEVKVKNVPELNDEFALSLGYDGVSNVTTLKEYVSNDIQTKKQDEVEMQYTNALVKAVADNTQIDLPQPMIDSEVNSMYDQFIKRLESQGLNEEMFLSMTQQTKEDITKQMEGDAIDKIKITLCLEAITEKEGIVVSDEEVEAEFEKIAAMYNMDVDQVKQMIPDTQGIKFEVGMQKALDLIKDSVK
ncbi:MAG: trigger factor, partial [Bacilli bacterium]